VPEVPRPSLRAGMEVLKDAEVSLRRVIAGTPDRGHMLLGLRGVGKTVLLNRIEAMAADAGYQTVPWHDGRIACRFSVAGSLISCTV